MPSKITKAPAGTPDEFKTPFGGMDENAVNRWLEDRIGINKSFALMNLWERCSRSDRSREEAERIFRDYAKREGYEEKVIEHYLKYLAD